MAEPLRAHFMGEFANDAACLAYLVASQWTTAAGDPWQGMFYHNTTYTGYRIWTGTVWEDLGAGYGQPTYYGPNVKVEYNETKDRMETWARCSTGTHEWVLHDVTPGRVWEERFMSQATLVIAVLGLSMEQEWTFNGRRNGAVDPDAGAFTNANEIGGGLSLNAIAGGQDNDYAAIHWGGNYPTMCDRSPYLHLVGSPEQITTVAHMGGLVDNTRPAGNAAFALPDNGIFLIDDTDVDGNLHFHIRSNGVSVSDTLLGPPVAGTHFSAQIVVNDDGEQVKLVLAGSVAVNWVDISGAAYAALRAVQLQPYFAVVNRAAAILRQFHLHDMRFIMDGGL